MKKVSRFIYFSTAQREAVEAMLTQAEQAARGEGESYSYDDVFGPEGE